MKKKTNSYVLFQVGKADTFQRFIARSTVTEKPLHVLLQTLKFMSRASGVQHQLETKLK